MSQYEIEINDDRSESILEPEFLREAVCRVLLEEQIHAATISLALVNDAEIQRVNRDHLGHDYPTDVISFLLNSTPPLPEGNPSRLLPDLVEHEATAETSVKIEGEIIVSTETARREANVHGWSPAAELLLYVVHGLLHLCGYDDLTDDARPHMRSRERELLAIWGFYPTGLEP